MQRDKVEDQRDQTRTQATKQRFSSSFEACSPLCEERCSRFTSLGWAVLSLFTKPASKSLKADAKPCNLFMHGRNNLFAWCLGELNPASKQNTAGLGARAEPTARAQHLLSATCQHHTLCFYLSSNHQGWKEIWGSNPKAHQICPRWSLLANLGLVLHQRELSASPPAAIPLAPVLQVEGGSPKTPFKSTTAPEATPASWLRVPRAFLLAGCPELTRLNLMSHHHCQIPRTMATADIFNQNKPQGQREASCKRNKSKGNIWHFTFDREGLINFYCGGIKSETKDPLSLHSQDAEGLSHPCTENSCSKSLHLIMIDSLLKNKSVQPGTHANTFPPVFPRPTF